MITNRTGRAVALALVPLCVGLAGLVASAGSRPTEATALAYVPSAPEVDGTEPLPPGAIVQTVLSNMTKPVAMAFDPQGRLFYTEKETGRVRLFENGVLRSTPVITYTVDGTCSERGLLGIAIDPDFANNHYMYVYYTAAG